MNRATPAVRLSSDAEIPDLLPRGGQAVSLGPSANGPFNASMGTARQTRATVVALMYAGLLNVTVGVLVVSVVAWRSPDVLGPAAPIIGTILGLGVTCFAASAAARRWPLASAGVMFLVFVGLVAAGALTGILEIQRGIILKLATGFLLLRALHAGSRRQPVE